MTEGQVHGGSSVWQSIKQALPFGRHAHVSAPGPAKQPTEGTRLNVHANAAVLERVTPSAGGGSAASDGGIPRDHRGEAQDDAAPQPCAAPVFGYGRSLHQRYKVLDELARGGNGVVTLVEDIHTHRQWAMKSLPKRLADPNVSERKRQDHEAAIRREVEVLRRLRGCLNVASLQDVYEDDDRVHIVMELCRGGELHHRIGTKHYSERTVASYMRATLRTLAQCHANKILHRDIKPGNFLLSSEDDRAPLKAVDFGLAVFFEDSQLPRTDLGFEGTPWFMAPEVLSSKVGPAADVWSAGVMAHQLLTGRFPFDDRTTPASPSLSRVWKSILTDKLDLKRSHWSGVSEEAKDFVARLLDKDPAKRPSAKEALKHPWLQGAVDERSSGRPLGLAVVQRIQRYSQASLFKRSVLELIAEELLAEANGPLAATAGSAAAPAAPAATCALSEQAQPLITSPVASPLEYLYERLRLVDRALVDRTALADGLSELGYRLTPAEVERLLDQLDPGLTGQVAKAQFAASQMDWHVVQQNHTEQWLRCARRTFAALDADEDGKLSTEDIVALLRHKLPPSEVEATVRQALEEAARRRPSETESAEGGSVHGGASSHGPTSPRSASDASLRDGLNFRQFLRMLTVGSADSLDLYEDRHGSLGSGSFRGGSMLAMVGSPDAKSSAGTSPLDRINLLLERSVRGGDSGVRPLPLEPVPEAPDTIDLDG